MGGPRDVGDHRGWGGVIEGRRGTHMGFKGHPRTPRLLMSLF